MKRIEVVIAPVIRGQQGSQTRTYRLFCFGVIAAVSLGLFLARPAMAWEYRIVKAGSDRIIFNNVDGVCTALAKDFRHFRHLPHGMACKRELDPALGFSRPKWRTLDVATHIPLATSIIQRYYYEFSTIFPKSSTVWKGQLLQMAKAGKFTLEVTQVDLFSDGKLENLVRLGFGKKCNLEEEVSGAVNTWEQHKRIFVVDPTLNHVDPFSDKGYYKVADDVFLFKGKVYSDAFRALGPSARSSRKIDGTLTIYSLDSYGTPYICIFDYFDKSPSKGDK